MKKLVSILLSAAMVVCVATSAFAEGSPDVPTPENKQVTEEEAKKAEESAPVQDASEAIGNTTPENQQKVAANVDAAADKLAEEFGEGVTAEDVKNASTVVTKVSPASDASAAGAIKIVVSEAVEGLSGKPTQIVTQCYQVDTYLSATINGQTKQSDSTLGAGTSLTVDAPQIDNRTAGTSLVYTAFVTDANGDTMECKVVVNADGTLSIVLPHTSVLTVLVLEVAEKTTPSSSSSSEEAYDAGKVCPSCGTHHCSLNAASRWVCPKCGYSWVEYGQVDKNGNPVAGSTSSVVPTSPKTGMF